MLVRPIPLTIQEGAKTKEMILFEFQGEFEHTELSDQSQFAGLDLGQLTEKAQGTYELTVGNHLLKGKLQSLTRPMILTHKQKTEDGHVNMEVQAVIRKKILFSTRPTPLKKQESASTTTAGNTSITQAGAAAGASGQGEKRRKLN